MTEYTHVGLTLTAKQAAIAMILAIVDGDNPAPFPTSRWEQIHHALLYGYLEETRAPHMIAVEALVAALAGVAAGSVLSDHDNDTSAAAAFLRGKALELEVYGNGEPPC